MVLRQNGKRLFPLGVYDMPRTDDEWRVWIESGIRLMPCGRRERLDLAAEHGSFGWARMPMTVTNAEEERKLRDTVESLADHPALALWQAPDEPIHFASKFPSDGRPVKAPWYLSDEDRAAWRAHLDAVTEGLIRGAEIVREIDPSRPIWLNDTAGVDRDALARVAQAFDIVGFDMYPVGEEFTPLAAFGTVIDDYAATAPSCEIWPVQQAFSWSLLNADRPEAFPNRRDLRFVAWQSLSRGCTGLHWWGHRHVEIGHPFLDVLWPVVGELHRLNDLLLGTDLVSVRVHAHYLVTPKPVYGLTHVARRVGDKYLLAIINQDPYDQNAVVSGLEEAGIDDPNDLRPLTPDDELSYRTEHERFTRIDSGWVIPLDGHSVRVWSSEVV